MIKSQFALTRSHLVSFTPHRNSLFRIWDQIYDEPEIMLPGASQAKTAAKHAKKAKGVLDLRNRLQGLLNNAKPRPRARSASVSSTGSTESSTESSTSSGSSDSYSSASSSGSYSTLSSTSTATTAGAAAAVNDLDLACEAVEIVIAKLRIKTAHIAEHAATAIAVTSTFQVVGGVTGAVAGAGVGGPAGVAIGTAAAPAVTETLTRFGRAFRWMKKKHNKTLHVDRRKAAETLVSYVNPKASSGNPKYLAETILATEAVKDIYKTLLSHKVGRNVMQSGEHRFNEEFDLQVHSCNFHPTNSRDNCDGCSNAKDTIYGALLSW